MQCEQAAQGTAHQSRILHIRRIARGDERLQFGVDEGQKRACSPRRRTLWIGLSEGLLDGGRHAGNQGIVRYRGEIRYAEGQSLRAASAGLFADEVSWPIPTTIIAGSWAANAPTLARTETRSGPAPASVTKTTGSLAS